MSEDAAKVTVNKIIRADGSSTTVSGKLRKTEQHLVKSTDGGNFEHSKARRALRALKALVKLQVLVRAHIPKKQTAEMMRHLQALIRAQARARTLRSQIFDATTRLTSHFQHHGPLTPETVEYVPHTKHDHRYTH